ncbi:hypothetical protein [Corynebacterium sp.]|uniref:hypothetical protein n=1 Tax=Corynebacterium sp. TaxID=1720 RepID=UPI0026E0CAA4|nr:hypothetical protein [Corynebacterium sp.]MDO5512030.1 hypothetical protein [Corynebacterium sp.]
MHDPRVLDAVRRVWEGHPDMSLPTLFAMLANRGVGWGATDEDLLRELAAMEKLHPAELPLVDARVTARYLVITEAPAHRVMVDPWRVIVRRPGVTAQPGVWRYATVRPAVIGGPLVVTSADGVDHRLGVLTRMTLLDDIPTSTVDSLSGLRRRTMGDAVYLVILDDDSQVVLSHGFEHFVAGRRALHQDSRAWEQLVACEAGQALVMQPPGGGPEHHLAPVREILTVEQ